MGIRFVTPDTVTLPLSDGDSITIKKRLSHGERDAMLARMRADEGKDLRAAELAGYLVSWSSATPYSLAMSEDERIATINGLDPDSYDEMRDALKAHVEAQQEKKLLNGGTASSPISPSAASITGPTTMSADSPQISTT